MSFGMSFLHFPDLFPGRRSGEPWGGRTVILDVAGGPYLFLGLSQEQEEAVHGRFGRLCRDGGDTSVATRVFRAPAADFLEIDTRGWEYTLDMEHEPASVRLAGMRLMARLDWTPALSGGLWTSEAAGEEWVSVFENYLRVLTAYRLLEGGGAVIHSAGVFGQLPDGEAAWLLLGPSGAGKTTASRLCLDQGASVLSDDLNAVHLEEGGALAVRLPFTGDLGTRSGGPARLPLRAVLRLVQGKKDEARPVTPAAALAALVAAAPFVNRDPFRREALLAILERLARSVPAWELTFTLEGDVWAILTALPS
jgi:hypothetical protein